MNEEQIFRGNQLAPGELVVWQGGPTLKGIACDIFHLRAALVYIAALVALDGYQAWAKHIPALKALHNSVPLFLGLGLATGIFATLAYMTARTTRYMITNRRVIMKYGMAMPVTLSLPYRQIVGASVEVDADHTGKIALLLRADNHMPYLKLYPFARAWMLARPEPMLRAVPHVALVAGLLTRALQAAERSRRDAPMRHRDGKRTDEPRVDVRVRSRRSAGDRPDRTAPPPNRHRHAGGRRAARRPSRLFRFNSTSRSGRPTMEAATSIAARSWTSLIVRIAGRPIASVQGAPSAASRHTRMKQ